MKRIEQQAQPVKALSILHVQGIIQFITTVFNIMQYNRTCMLLMSTQEQIYVNSITY